jgi:hypothetical protein
MRFRILFIVMIMLLQVTVAKSPPRSRTLELVFVMDLSGSTNGLLNDLKGSYYSLLNELISLRPAPEIRIGLVGYGRPSYGKETSYVKTLVPLTSDVNLVYREISKIKTDIESGNQYVGAALLHTARNMAWLPDGNSLKTICIVGNGTTDSGSKSYKKAFEELKLLNVVVNAVYCRSDSRSEKELPGWKDLAEEGSGGFKQIMINRAQQPVPLFTDPQRLYDLNSRLNATYINFGPNGQELLNQLVEVDNQIWISYRSEFEARVHFKTGKLFSSLISSWELTEHSYKQAFDPSQIDMLTLNESYHRYNNQQLRALVLDKRIEKINISQEIFNLSGGLERQKRLRADRTDKKLEEEPVFKVAVGALMTQTALQAGFQE